MEILTKRPVISAEDYNNVEFNSYEDTPMEASSFDNNEVDVDEEMMSNAFGDKLKEKLQDFRANKGSRVANRSARRSTRKVKQSERKDKRQSRQALRRLNRKEKGNIFQRFIAKIKAGKQARKDNKPLPVATAAPLQVSNQSTSVETKFNRPLPEEVETRVLGNATTPPAPQTKEELATAYRVWANSTPALKVKYGKDSPFDLDAIGSANDYFDASYKSGKAVYEASTAKSGMNLTNAEVVTIEPTGVILASDPSKVTTQIGSQTIATANVPTGAVPLVDENGNASTLHGEAEVVLATDNNGKENVFLKTDTDEGGLNVKNWSTLKKVMLFGVAPLITTILIIVAVKMSKKQAKTSKS
tara:strand:- start:1510 stop:2583 length:1074 start_codon:yes stop_codon:yes gene_type:complete